MPAAARAGATAVLKRVRVLPQLISRSVQAGPVPRKDAAFTATDYGQPLSALGVANGDIVFLDYQMERENQAVNMAYAKDPFVSLVKVPAPRFERRAYCARIVREPAFRNSRLSVLVAPSFCRKASC